MRKVKWEMGKAAVPTSPPAEVQEVAAALVGALGENLTALLWHGSWARGEQTPESDHDLIVVVRLVDEEVLRAMAAVFKGRGLWSTYLKTEAELRQYPMTGRLQFHHGLVPLYGDIERPPVTREGLLEDVRRLVTDIEHEARYRIIHGGAREHAGMDAEYVRIRTARWLYYQTKLALLALKARELLNGSAYPASRRELRSRLTDGDEIAIIDTIEGWPAVKSEYEEDFTPLALLLDRCCRKLIMDLETSQH